MLVMSTVRRQLLASFPHDMRRGASATQQMRRQWLCHVCCCTELLRARTLVDKCAPSETPLRADGKLTPPRCGERGGGCTQSGAQAPCPSHCFFIKPAGRLACMTCWCYDGLCCKAEVHVLQNCTANQLEDAAAHQLQQYTPSWGTKTWLICVPPTSATVAA